MPAKHPTRIAALTLALSLVVAAPASALQPPDLQVVNLAPGSQSSYASNFTRLGAWDYFTGDDDTVSGGIWRTNGSTTELVSDEVGAEAAVFNYGASDTTYVALGSYLYFAGYTAAYGDELWRTDGVTTSLVKDINPGVSNGTIANFKKLGSYLYFTAQDATHGWELWRTNGTTTTMVKDIQPGSGDSYPDNFTEFAGKLYFGVTTVAAGWEMGSTDGTSAGTVVYDMTAGAAGSSPQDFTTFQNRLYFSGPGADLWYTNGTGNPLVFPYSPESVHDLTVMGSQLYFSGSDSDDGRELWVTTGDIADAAGTAQVADIQVGSAGSDPMYLTVLGSRIYFSAYTEEYGRELWSSNGLAGPGGTALVRDLNVFTAGSFGVDSNPKSLTVFGGSIFLYAESTDGPRLWRVDSSTSAVPHSSIPLAYEPGLFSEFAYRRLYPSGDKLYVQTNAAGAGQEFAWMQAPAAPKSVAAPAITGTAKVGKVLTGARGSWSGVPSAITSAQWYRCTRAGTTTPTTSSLSGCVAISGATKATYKAVAADKGKYLRLRVKAQNESGTIYRWSKATGKIAP